MDRRGTGAAGKGEKPLKESLAERVYRELRASVVLGDIKPGSTFNEADLVKRFGVSTSPLREALTRLHQDGLIRTIPRKGYIVNELTLSDFHDLIQLRLVLESAAAELAAPRMTDEHIQEMIRLSRVCVNTGDASSYRAFMDANQAFHELIAEASGNARLAKAVKHNFEEVQRILFANIGVSSAQAHAPDDHQGIIDALAKRDPGLARSAVIAHIKQSRDRIVERLVRSSDALSSNPIGFF